MNWERGTPTGIFSCFCMPIPSCQQQGLEAVRWALQEGIVGEPFALLLCHLRRPYAWSPGARICVPALIRLPYGSQALFMPQQVFEALGGYDEIPFMERRDVRLVRALRKRGRLHAPPAGGARLGAAGNWTACSIPLCVILSSSPLYFWGVPPEKLQRWYGARRRSMEERGGMAV